MRLCPRNQAPTDRRCIPHRHHQLLVCRRSIALVASSTLVEARAPKRYGRREFVSDTVAPERAAPAIPSKRNVRHPTPLTEVVVLIAAVEVGEPVPGGSIDGLGVNDACDGDDRLCHQVERSGFGAQRHRQRPAPRWAFGCQQVRVNSTRLGIA
jgi:hypothetical protein